MSHGVSQIYNKLIRIIPILELTAVSSTNQPTGDNFEVVSNNAGDTQKITVWYTETGSVSVKYETLTLTGATAVASTSAVVDKVIGAFLGTNYGAISARATGTITIRKKTGALAITTIAATKLSYGSPYFYLNGNNVTIENIAGNTWFNTVYENGTTAVATTTGASGQMASRMKNTVKVKDYLSLVSDGTGSTVQVYVEEE